MNNIEIEGKLVYLDQLLDNALRLAQKVESFSDGRIYFYKCYLNVPLSLNFNQFIQDMMDWSMWKLDVSLKNPDFFISGIIVLNMSYSASERSAVLTFVFPEEHRSSNAKFYNTFLNLKFKNFSSWQNKIEALHQRVKNLEEESKKYYNNLSI